MFGQTEIYNALNIGAIQAVVDTDKDGNYAIYADSVIPTRSGAVKTINFYMSAEYDARLDYEAYRYSISCRARTLNESQTIAKTVSDNINRVSYAGYYINCSILPVIHPEDDNDNYNTPVELWVKKR